jgi:hypothetical protein
MALLSLSESALMAQSAPQPGQLMAAAMPLASFSDAEALAPVPAQGRSIAAVPESPSTLLRHVWFTSVGALVAATGFDAATSWGHREANGLLASGSGNFGAKGISLKLVGLGAVLVPQVMLRHHSTWLKIFSASNAAEAGVYTGAAVHNIHVTSGN